ncbi:type II toxin-antitoxin system Phd/YefM family antitoxin [Saccharopolyspora gloriosae]|uniref:type II toxin-antitoxin system Phd/YefM family antitoxin n=1 Tax=Saccharopolyspora gloriosae TaxID=455344 RepID=UPI001FB5A57F|nr:type II toxin-antitoxin system prevent-host-death family antitoxin [Saccharopolyspora gloriosae]
MERIGVRELRQNASRYLKRVATGESILVTDRGRTVAVLNPPSRAHSLYDELIAAGELIPGDGGDLPEPGEPDAGDLDTWPPEDEEPGSRTAPPGDDRREQERH